MELKYNISVHDNIVDLKLQELTRDYVVKQKWRQTWYPEEPIYHYYTDLNDTSWANDTIRGRHTTMPRACFASDDGTLKRDHLPVYLFWKELNRQLGNKYELAGYPEGVRDPTAISPDPIDTSLSRGWRAYANAIPNESIIGQSYPHRDTPDLNDETSVTMLYFLNTEWYPSWHGEVRFYPEDPDGTTGDHQQFNPPGMQSRGFNVGWLDQGRIVSPVPGRLLIYDGRCLHGTNPTKTGLNNPAIRLVFRARLKS